MEALSFWNIVTKMHQNSCFCHFFAKFLRLRRLCIIIIIIIIIQIHKIACRNTLWRDLDPHPQTHAIASKFHVCYFSFWKLVGDARSAKMHRQRPPFAMMFFLEEFISTAGVVALTRVIG